MAKALSDAFDWRLSDVWHLSVCLSRTPGLYWEQRGLGRLEFITEVGHVTRDSDTPLSRSKDQGAGRIVAASRTACLKSRRGFCATSEPVILRGASRLAGGDASAGSRALEVVTSPRPPHGAACVQSKLHKLGVYTVRSSDRPVGPTQATSDCLSDQSDRRSDRRSDRL